jgi:gas vesicle protein
MGRFVLGFVVGAAVGAAVVIATSPEWDEATQRYVWPGSVGDMVRRLTDTGQQLSARARIAYAEGRSAASVHEQQMWTHFRHNLPRNDESAESDQA